MSDLGDLLELMYAAHSRATSVRAVLTEWSDTDLWRESARRWAETGPRRSRALLVAESRGVDTGSTERHTHRVWRRYPGPSWRVESDRAPYPHVTIMNGRHWWGSDGRGGTLTNVRADGSMVENMGGSLPSRFIELIFDPASLLSSTSIDVGEETIVAGRKAREAVARWRPGIDLVQIDWPYADAIKLAVDAELGVLLLFEALLDQRPFLRWQAEEIVFGEDLNDGLFAGPPGARAPVEPSPAQVQAEKDLNAEIQRLRRQDDRDADRAPGDG